MTPFTPAPQPRFVLTVLTFRDLCALVAIVVFVTGYELGWSALFRAAVTVMLR